jgi:hypothetical protein
MSQFLVHHEQGFIQWGSLSRHEFDMGGISPPYKLEFFLRPFSGFEKFNNFKCSNFKAKKQN